MAERSRLSQIPGTHTVTIPTILIAAATSDEVALWVNKHNATVRMTACSFTPETAVTANDTNNFTLQIRNKGTDGTGTTGVTQIRTLNVAGGSIAAFDEDGLTLSTTAADTDIDTGEVVALDKGENGSGLELPAGVITLEFQFSQ